MEVQSPYLLMQQFERLLLGHLSAIDIYDVPAAERKVITALKHETVDARLDIRDYELSETREEQLDNAKEAKSRLQRLHKHILAASEYNVFSAIDVAQMSATLEQIKERLK
jgi:hypothetical protein